MTRGSGVTAAALGAGLLVFAGCADPTRGSPVGAASVGGAAAYAAQIVQETNHVRAVAGRPALRASQCAAAAARARAAQLVGTATLTHLPLAGVIARCPPAGTAAENLSRASVSPREVIDAWLGSPGHRANLLDPELKEIGVGCVVDDAAMLCSQIFLGPDQ